MISFEILANEVILSLWWPHSKRCYDAQSLGRTSFLSDNRNTLAKNTCFYLRKLSVHSLRCLLSIKKVFIV